jgi:hypothetical protein
MNICSVVFIEAPSRNTSERVLDDDISGNKTEGKHRSLN